MGYQATTSVRDELSAHEGPGYTLLVARGCQGTLDVLLERNLQVQIVLM